MTAEHKDGGRAFPCDQIIERDADGHLHGKEVASGGMTLRDYFAAQIIQGMLAGMLADGSTLNTDEALIHARIAYLHADAMLKARKL